MDGHHMLNLRHEASWARWRKDRLRNNPPPFLGPLVTIKEAMEAVNRSESYVRNRIDDGRLNTWKDPVSKRVWILKDDVDILKGDIRALEEKGETRGGKRGPRKPPNPQSAIQNPQSEDLDAIGGWEHPKPPEIIGGAAIEESARESQARYDQKVRENEEWYAAELAKLEDRDPEEAVRQLRLERGWTTPESEEPESVPASFDSVYDAAQALDARATTGRKITTGPAPVNRPISYSDPNPRPRTLPESYIDPDDPPYVRPDESRIEVPFPMGWITGHQVSNILQVSLGWVGELVKQGKLQRRRYPKRRGASRWLYDSVEVETLAESRLARDKGPIPGKNLNAWGSRAHPIELTEYNAWISVKEAARILGVLPGAVTKLCDRGKLPAKQKEPGKPGSRVFVPHFQVKRLLENPEYQQRRKSTRGEKTRTDEQIEQSKEDWLPFGVAPIVNQGKRPRKDHGEYYDTTQVANLLGVSRSAIHGMRTRGRLKAYQIGRIRKGRTGERNWWFFLKTDVDALRADPVYIAKHKQWVKVRNRQAGWPDT